MNRGIPTEDEWGAWQSDVDTSSAHDVFFGKSNKDLQENFYKCVIERTDELRFMPDIPFQYYMLGFRDFVMAGNFQLFEAADAASNFLKLVEYKLKNQPQSIKPLLYELMPSINYVCENQSAFDAEIDIYGDFMELKKSIESLSKALNSPAT